MDIHGCVLELIKLMDKKYVSKPGVILPVGQQYPWRLGKMLAITRQRVSKRFGRDGTPKGDRRDMLGSSIRHGLSQQEAESESGMQLYAPMTAQSGPTLMISQDSRTRYIGQRV